jgi:molybdate transport system ATP-binding protein
MLYVQLHAQTEPKLDVSFTCQKGQLLALVGPSGAGKSTVLRCIAGLHKADQGKILSEGKAWFDSSARISLSPQSRRVGVVFQNYALFPHMTVAENIAIALGEHATDEQIDVLLNKVRLSGLALRYPHQLSGGQQQRVAIARALAREPDVLLLDEPFSAVDKVTRRKLYLELTNLRAQLDMPIVLVTHDLDEAAMLADTMVVIHHGRTLQQATPSTLLHQPSTVNVAKLVDVRNLFSGEIEAIDGERWLKWQGYHFRLAEGTEIEQTSVSWTISPTRVILHQRVRPSKGQQENPVTAEISQMLTLRGVTTVLLKPTEVTDGIIQMDISEHVAQRNQLTIGDVITVSILSEAIHLMTE